MKIIDDVLDYPAKNSIFVKSINPLQTGLVLFKFIDDVKANFNFSVYTAEAMKEKCEKYMISLLKMYKCPNEIKPILDNLDVEGRDCFWYFQNYQMFRLMESKILN